MGIEGLERGNLVASYLNRRPRRNRKSPAIRALVNETILLPSHLVAPLFIMEGEQVRQPINSMPGINRISIDVAIQEVEKLYGLGIRAIDLFCVIPADKKDRWGSEAVRRGNLLGEAIKKIKEAIPEICIMADIALDPYTDHGHDGVLDDQGDVDNDATLALLAEMCLLAAEAGVDVVAPSDMMDGRVAHIRQTLDENGFPAVSILAYAAKYTSAFYGPFREALDSAPKVGDKKSYQLNPANVREALLECNLDEKEGADFLLIKPAMAYLDVIARLREMTHLPLAAYHVSGEYAMVMAAAERGWLDADQVFMESLIAIRRAGADFILTYAAERIARIL